MASLIASFSVRVPLETGTTLRTKKLHAHYVEGLALDILLAHVDHALETEAGACGGRSHAVLAGAGFGDNAGLVHALGEENFAPSAVVDLACAPVWAKSSRLK